ncbi:MAG: hypothetical protein M1830_008370 [Pleopsidium flavum]|nr:MAG: hypothetical protein M1830_008370 [Pleopsidium flavum]
MPDSSPKRVTRARAKAVEGTTVTAKAVKVTTMAKKAAVDTKKVEKVAKEDAGVVKPVATTKRKTRTDDVDEQAVRKTQAGIAKISIGRAKMGDLEKSEVVEDNAATKPAAPKPRGRPKKVTVSAADDKPDEPQKSRERSKKTTIDAANTKPETKDDVEKEVPAKKITRARAIATGKGIATAKIKPTAVKKRVTFKDDTEQEKENRPLVTEVAAKTVQRPRGLRAKPVRKPAAVKGISGAKKVEMKGEKVEEHVEVRPLSPKKAKQIAKTGSTSSEDELNGEKTPIKLLNKSPVRPPMSIGIGTGTQGVSKLDFAYSMAPVSPTKAFEASVLATPARRPPPSPVKDSVQASPKRLNVEGTLMQPALNSLQISPKRLNLESMLMQPALKASKTPLKTSLLQSPARRPAPSPFVSAAPTSPGKAALSTPKGIQSTVIPRVNTFELPVFSSQKNITSALRAAKSPDHSIKVQNMARAEQVDETIMDCSKSPSDVFSQDATCAGIGSKYTTPAPNEKTYSTKSSAKSSKIPLMMHNRPASPKEEQEQPAIINQEAKPQSNTRDILDGGPTSRSTTPPGPPLPLTSVAFSLQSPATQYPSDESDSEDELQSVDLKATSGPLGIFNISTKDFGSAEAPGTSMGISTPKSAETCQPAQEDLDIDTVTATGTSSKGQNDPMTPLALQLSTWLAASPEKEESACLLKSRGVFSPSGDLFLPQPTQDPTSALKQSLVKPTFFEDEMSIRDQQDGDSQSSGGNHAEEDAMSVQLSQESQLSEKYGDENAMPIDPQLLTANTMIEASRLTCTPSRVFSQGPRVIHTVSKVPLRPAGEDSPLKVPRKRSRSVSGPLSAHKPHPDSGDRDESVTESSTPPETLTEDYNTPTRLGSTAPLTPVTGTWSTIATPARTPRRGLDAEILKGAIVYVDVYTSEGADASGIFVELLAQMGARCVKQWPWNPRASSGNFSEGTGSVRDTAPDTSKETATPGGKVGITHVVFKDGGKRTMEKVRESNGVVLCVGVGWVLDCERENKWLDEADYAVDISMVPRGGQRRRKSMEPRALSNINGSLVPADSPAKRIAELSPTKEFLTFSSPTSRRESFAIQMSLPQPETPASVYNRYEYDDSPSEGSPTTPYYLSKGAALVQQTCPPKQTQQSLFPLSGRIEDQPSERMRQRLLMARRKSLQWAPKVGSPLGRAVSYGK